MSFECLTHTENQTYIGYFVKQGYVNFYDDIYPEVITPGSSSLTLLRPVTPDDFLRLFWQVAKYCESNPIRQFVR